VLPAAPFTTYQIRLKKHCRGAACCTPDTDKHKIYLGRSKQRPYECQNPFIPLGYIETFLALLKSSFFLLFPVALMAKEPDVFPLIPLHRINPVKFRAFYRQNTRTTRALPPLLLPHQMRHYS